MADLVIALIGNPNSGKSSLFNALTGAHQHVGNWPGKTVEKKKGTLVHNGQSITVVDLPGTYSLAALSLEEVIARDFIVEEHPDVVVDVVDATNLERNLYLAVQLLEMGGDVVIALNVMDQARALGIEIDIERLSQSLGGVPVVPTVARRDEGVPELLDAVLRAANTRQTSPVKEKIA
jgi:ferrous iron transport protein B